MNLVYKFGFVFIFVISLSLASSSSYGYLLEDKSDFDVILINNQTAPQTEDFLLLDHELTSNTEFLKALKKEGVIRVVIGANVNKEQVENFVLPQLKSILQKHGVNINIEIVFIKVDIQKVKKEAIEEVLQENLQELCKNQDILDSKDSTTIKIKKGLKNFFRSFVIAKYIPRLMFAIPSEMVYLGKTLYKSLQPPKLTDVLQGSLLIPIALSQYVAAYIDNPIALVSAFTISLALETFHNIWVSSWLDFQKRLNQERGHRYQLIFNWTYGQFWGIVFRTISYSAGVAKDWVLSWNYIMPAITTSALSSFGGSLAYNGLNKLYQLGVYSKNKRDFIQLYMRQALGIIIGTQFCLGANMTVFWGLFTLQQTLNLYYWVKSELSSQRPMLLVVPKDVKESEEFAKLFPNAFEANLTTKQLTFIEFVKNKCIEFKEYLKFLFYSCSWVFNFL